MIDERTNNLWTVYVHILSGHINSSGHDKYYVGITKNNVAKRWRRNGIGYQSSNYFYNAIKKYGWDNFQHEIIAEHLTRDEACDFEIALIKQLKANDREYGYNTQPGGDVHTGYKYSEEAKIMLKTMNKGKNNHFYGKRHTNETKKLMSQNHYDCSGDKNPRCTPLYVFEYDNDDNLIFKQFYSYIDRAASELNIDVDCIYSALYHKRRYKRYCFARKEDITFNNNTPYLKYIPKIKIGKKVYQFTVGGKYIGKYNGYADASNNTGLKREGIRFSAINNKPYKGFYFKLKDFVRESDDNPGSFLML